MKLRSTAPLLLAAIVLTGCDSSIYRGSSDNVLGPVPVTIQVVAPSAGEAQEAIDAALAAMTQANALFSSYVPQSEVSRLNQSGGRECHVSSQTAVLLARSVEISRLTGGAFDITSGPLITLWKKPIKAAELYRELSGTKVEAPKPKLPAKEAIDAARKLVGYKRLTLGPNSAKLETPGMTVDLGGIAKGYAVDKAIAALKAKGIRNALVDAGGDGYALGTKPDGKPWRIGVQVPDGATGEHFSGVLDLSDTAYATSGDYEQYAEIDGVRYAHIIDPRTGQPARVAVSVTVIAPDCTTADALATGISVLGPVDGIGVADKVKGVECMIISRQGEDLKTAVSSGFRTYQTSK